MTVKGQTNRRLGYPPDGRLLILNADDFGFCGSINRAIAAVLAQGVVRSTTLMVPCPGAPEALEYLAGRPTAAFGIHLTAIRDGEHSPWGPLCPAAQVPSLVDPRDPQGRFYPFDRMADFLAQLRPEDLEREFRAQIEAVLAAGLRPTHLDWHSLRIRNRVDLFSRLGRLAREYGLALRVMGPDVIDLFQTQGLPTIDYDFLDSSALDPATKPAEYARLLRELPEGLSEWAVHPGWEGAELAALEPGGSRFRQTDADFWTSPQAGELIAHEGITLLDYRPLQALWQAG